MSDLVPVQIRHSRDHRFVKRDTRGCGFVKPDGKACGRGKTNPLHHGPPPSLNTTGAGYSPHAYHSAKTAWQTRLVELLVAADLPHDLGGVLVEGRACFPDRIRRDQGNYRYFIEKALGDALVEGDPLNDVPGWLEDDDWDRYEFGQLAKTYEKGEAWIELIIFSRPRVDASAEPVQASLLLDEGVAEAA